MLGLNSPRSVLVGAAFGREPCEVELGIAVAVAVVVEVEVEVEVWVAVAVAAGAALATGFHAPGGGEVTSSDALGFAAIAARFKRALHAFIPMKTASTTTIAATSA